MPEPCTTCGQTVPDYALMHTGAGVECAACAALASADEARQERHHELLRATALGTALSMPMSVLSLSTGPFGLNGLLHRQVECLLLMALAISVGALITGLYGLIYALAQRRTDQGNLPLTPWLGVSAFICTVTGLFGVAAGLLPMLVAPFL